MYMAMHKNGILNMHSVWWENNAIILYTFDIVIRNSLSTVKLPSWNG